MDTQALNALHLVWPYLFISHGRAKPRGRTWPVG